MANPTDSADLLVFSTTSFSGAIKTASFLCLFSLVFYSGTFQLTEGVRTNAMRWILCNGEARTAPLCVSYTKPLTNILWLHVKTKFCTLFLCSITF